MFSTFPELLSCNSQRVSQSVCLTGELVYLSRITIIRGLYLGVLFISPRTSIEAGSFHLLSRNPPQVVECFLVRGFSRLFVFLFVAEFFLLELLTSSRKGSRYD
jgi:hypothetical protein